MKKKVFVALTLTLLLLTLTSQVVASPEFHDLAVTAINVPNLVQANVSVNVKSTVVNLGSYLERDIKVRLLVNGSLSQSKTVAALKNGSNVEMSFLWTPQTEATFNLTVYVPPVVGETNVTNNARSSIVKASLWMPSKQIGYGAHPSLATDSNGYLYAVYDQDYSVEIYVRRSTDGGYSWTDFGRWSHPGYVIGNPSIAIDPYDNRVYVAYEVQKAVNDHDIYCKVYVPGKGWTESVQVTFGAGDDRYPSITSEYQYGTSNYQYISYEYLYSFDDRDLFVIRSKDHGVTWPNWWKLHGDYDGRVYAQPKITNAEGNLYLVYRVATDYLSTDGDIRVDISSDFGASWTTKLDIDGTTGDCWYPTIAATHGGSLVMVSFVYQSKVLYSYSQFKGSEPWHKGYILDPLLSYSSYPSLTVDGGGSTSNSVKGYVHAAYRGPWLTSGIFYKKALWYEPTNWSPRQNITNDSNVYSLPTITTQYRSSGTNYYPCVVFIRYVSPNYQIQYSTVAPLPFNYSLSVSPLLVEVEAGSWTTYTVTGTLVNGPSQTVTLTLYDLPSGVAYTYFTSRYVTPSFVSTLIIGVYGDAPGGNYSLTVVGEGSGIARSTMFNLRIKAKSSLTLKLTPSTVSPGQLLKISGQLTPNISTKIYLFYKQTVGGWTFYTTITTDQHGYYSVTATVPSLPPQNIDFVVFWPGNQFYQGAVSPIQTLTIT